MAMKCLFIIIYFKEYQISLTKVRVLSVRLMKQCVFLVKLIIFIIFVVLKKIN